MKKNAFTCFLVLYAVLSTAAFTWMNYLQEQQLRRALGIGPAPAATHYEPTPAFRTPR